MSKQSIVTQARNAVAGVLVTQGVVLVLFGIWALFWPGITASVFILLFGLFVLAWALLALLNSFLHKDEVTTWWVEVLFSVLAVGVGVFLLLNPGLTGQMLIVLVGVVLLIRGIVDVVTGMVSKDPDVKESRLFYFILGLLGILAALIIMLHPAASGLAFIIFLGLYSLIYGMLSIAFGFRVRRTKLTE